ncbi:MarR family winged helix-turn-helix transcriptional regulator [Mycolicibacterium stellerae]|uniref:MarR family winged helix-turn-helix transcriptional regulator n=1 Tax=Mycolicibacterium stellerae TaxID=2358193 RepID=UPI000F0B3A11|nr:MarR family transcriptional regulator [Mycolicibacterium stellerae]
MAQRSWLTATQQRTWVNYMQVYLRLEYEMNRQLQADFGVSLADYSVMNALSAEPGRRLQSSRLAIRIGWERSRLSHQLRRMEARRLVERVASESDGRATDAKLTPQGWRLLQAAAPKHVALVRALFFSDLDDAAADQLADLLGSVYETILRKGTLPRPE